MSYLFSTYKFGEAKLSLKIVISVQKIYNSGVSQLDFREGINYR